MIRGVRWLSVPPGSGYGDASEAYLSGLRGAGVPVTWTPLGWPSSSWDAPYGPIASESLDGAHRDVAELEIEHDVVVVCSTPLWHAQLAVEAEGRTLVAYCTWETDRLPSEYVRILNRYDRVLVPSRFNAAVFGESGVTAPVVVIPHIARPQPAAASGPRPAAARFVFYLIATWTTRKAILDTVSAFLEAFTGEDDVVLVIHTTPEDQVALARRAAGEGPDGRRDHAAWRTLAQALAGRGDAPAITLSTRTLTRAEIAELHERGDCFVSLSHGEGWGLGAFDAATHGKPVIVTGWGGTLEFLPSGYPYLVDYELVRTTTEEPDAWWAPRPGERWAKASVEHAARLLRQVFEDREAARLWGTRLQADVTAGFEETKVTARLIDAIAT